MGRDAFSGGLNGDVPAQGELDRAVRAAREAFAWRASVDALTAEGVIDGVRATVGGNGGLRGLTVATSACHDGGEAVAERILAAVAAAQQELARQIRGSVASTFGVDSHQAQTVNASLSTRFGLEGSSGSEA